MLQKPLYASSDVSLIARWVGLLGGSGFRNQWDLGRVLHFPPANSFYTLDVWKRFDSCTKNCTSRLWRESITSFVSMLFLWIGVKNLHQKNFKSKELGTGHMRFWWGQPLPSRNIIDFTFGNHNCSIRLEALYDCNKLKQAASPNQLPSYCEYKSPQLQSYVVQSMWLGNQNCFHLTAPYTVVTCI